MSNSIKTLGFAACFIVLSAASRVSAATPVRMFEVGENVNVQIFSKAIWQKYSLSTATANPLPPGLAWALSSTGGVAVTGSPTTAGTYLTKGLATDRVTKVQYKWEIKFIITPAYTRTTGTFSMTEAAKEDRNGIVKGSTKIAATINMQGQQIGPSDQLVVEAGDGFSFEADMSEIGFNGKKASFYTDDGGKVSLKFNRGILTITVAQAFDDSGESGNAAATEGVIVDGLIGDETGTVSDSFDVTITVGQMQASLTANYTARVTTKVYDADDTETSSVSVKAKGGN